MKSGLTVYKASAGSGKTFRLSVEYIKLLIENPKSYRNILAVTFTNKATAEMKTRIIGELYGLSKNLDESQRYLQTVCDETHKSKTEVCNRAALALTLILHDYGKFRVETIDSFFQTVLRNMAKELGMGTNFNVSLNDNEILKNAIKLMIENAGENSILLQWLQDSVSQKIEENKSWKIADDIENFYKNIISEKLKSRQDEIYKRFAEKNFLRLFRTKLNKLIESENEKMKEFAKHFFEIIQTNDLDVDDFYYTGKGVYGYFTKLADGRFVEENCFNTYVKNCAEDAEKWCRNKTKISQITSLAENTLISLLHKAELQRTESAKSVNSCHLILKNINNLGLLNDIFKHIHEYSNDNNIFLLSDTSVLLYKMIGNNDASFIFEKTGTAIQHIMIDEFQDTSQLQWKNFEPLFIECLSQGYSNLIVGDVKQAIYRWRNGNWQILNNIEENEKLHYFNPVVKTLGNSWRSAKEIVEFNNNLFPKIVDIIKLEYWCEYGENCDDLEKAYTDIKQECKRNVSGFVSVEFLEKSNYEEDVLNHLIGNVEMLQASGVKASDIAILVRKNDHTKQIAYYFEKYRCQNPDKNCCYNLVSSKTFNLNSSIAINMIINALRILTNAENTVAQADLAFYYQKNILGNDITDHEIFTGNKRNLLPAEFVKTAGTLKLTPLYELIEKIYLIFNLKKLDENAEYMFSFLDGINEYLNSETSDILKFIEYWETNMFKETIEISGEMDGIKIMTVHEAKGLEFHSVIIPFCDWTLGAEGNNYIWCETDAEPFSEAGTIPVKYTDKAKNSVFYNEYKNETMQLCVDNINILYVATTRAKNNLIILAKKETNNKKHNVSSVMYSALDNENFTSGQIVATVNAAARTSENKFNMLPQPLSVSFVSNRYNAEFIQSDYAREFAKNADDETIYNMVPVNRGKLLHRIFAEIKTQNDINAAVDKFQFDGIIQQSGKQELKDFVVNAITKSQVIHWYSGIYKLFTECAVITKNDKGEIITKRPDRVMIDNENTIVVDFKFGRQNIIYNTQVAEYMRLLREMNYKNVSGFLWYVDSNIVEEVID
ncbi:MAG: UvrD-helicase domain-containing protein [Prevotellaceae bacterium]|jgi:ATP-dependent exoDNAse (exonuclease V) beta subunit|nr:UvrD-helicase domain-containing protein [Prevotellaceae bacterium]